MCVYDALMDWLPLTSTLLEAFIGVGSTLVVDRAKWRRDQAREKRRTVYVEFLGALHIARESFWQLSRGVILPGVTPYGCSARGSAQIPGLDNG